MKNYFYFLSNLKKLTKLKTNKPALVVDEENSQVSFDTGSTSIPLGSAYKEVILTPEQLTNIVVYPLHEVLPPLKDNKYYTIEKIIMEFQVKENWYDEAVAWEDFVGMAGLYWWRVDDPNLPGEPNPEPVEISAVPIMAINLSLLWSYQAIGIYQYDSINYLDSKEEVIRRDQFIEPYKILNSGIAFGNWHIGEDPATEAWANGDGDLKLKIWYTIEQY